MPPSRRCIKAVLIVNLSNEEFKQEYIAKGLKLNHCTVSKI